MAQQRAAAEVFDELAGDEVREGSSAGRGSAHEGTMQALVSLRRQSHGGLGAPTRTSRPQVPSPARVGPGNPEHLQPHDDGGDGRTLTAAEPAGNLFYAFRSQNPGGAADNEGNYAHRTPGRAHKAWSSTGPDTQDAAGAPACVLRENFPMCSRGRVRAPWHCRRLCTRATAVGAASVCAVPGCAKASSHGQLCHRLPTPHHHHHHLHNRYGSQSAVVDIVRSLRTSASSGDITVNASCCCCTTQSETLRFARSPRTP